MGIIHKHKELHKVRSQVSRTPMSNIFKHVDFVQGACLHVGIAHTGITLKHFDELHRTRSYVRIAHMGIILKHFD